MGLKPPPPGDSGPLGSLAVRPGGLVGAAGPFVVARSAGVETAPGAGTAGSHAQPGYAVTRNNNT